MLGAGSCEHRRSTRTPKELAAWWNASQIYEALLDPTPASFSTWFRFMAESGSIQKSGVLQAPHSPLQLKHSEMLATLTDIWQNPTRCLFHISRAIERGPMAGSGPPTSPPPRRFLQAENPTSRCFGPNATGRGLTKKKLIYQR